MKKVHTFAMLTKPNTIMTLTPKHVRIQPISTDQVLRDLNIDHNKRMENIVRADEQLSEHCYICGKAMEVCSGTPFIHLFDGGDLMTINHVDRGHNGTSDDVGCWPIGKACYRKIGKYLATL